MITAVSIPSTIAVYGNGKTLGLSTSGINVGLFRGPQNCAVYAQNNAYGTNANTTVTWTGTDGTAYHTYGVTTDTTGKSGMVAKSNSITRTSISFKFCIKY